VFLMSASRRLGMATPFLVLAASVLTLWGTPHLPLPIPPAESPPLVLIVTTSSLSPAFEALDSWNEERGCRAVVITLPDEDARNHPERILASLRAVCARAGVTGLLLGADQRLLPFPGRSGDVLPSLIPSAWAGETPTLAPLLAPSHGWLPSGLCVGRAEVKSLPEAWAFVESCRGSGETLDVLLLRIQLRAEGPTGLSSPLRRGQPPTGP